MADLLIDIEIDKTPYVKTITADKVINLTGESGSGKSYFAQQYRENNNYVVIDTDELFSCNPCSNLETDELRRILANETKEMLFSDFDRFYTIVLDYFKNDTRTVVIDSAQFRNMKNCTMLRGEVIIMRTSINTCYQRCISRYKNENPHATQQELLRYFEKKRGMYRWYNALNDFIERVDQISPQ